MPESPSPPPDLRRDGPWTRPFKVRDAMILVAAAGVGAYGYRINNATMIEMEYGSGSRSRIEGWEMLAGPALASLTAGLIAIRLWPPRPPRVALFRQPGFAAAVVALALVGREFGEWFLLMRYGRICDWFTALSWEGSMQQASVGILVVWTGLALAGCLKAERGWVDRSLRAVAILWVFAGIASRLVPMIEVEWYDYQDARGFR